MKRSKVLSNTLLGIGTVGIYAGTLYAAYTLFYEYSYVGNFEIVFGVVMIMLIGEWCVLSLFSFHRRYSQNNKATISTIAPEEKKKEKEVEIIPTSKLPQNKKDKRIQENYKAILLDYKRNLSPREYKKFQEDTQYDILIYDALMVSRDKEGKLLSKLENEKGEFYANTLRKILE